MTMLMIFWIGQTDIYDTGQHCSDHHVENDDDDYDDNDEMT